jgi:hypothetical protein
MLHQAKRLRKQKRTTQDKLKRLGTIPIVDTNIQ